MNRELKADCILPVENTLKRIYHKKDNHLLIFCEFSRDRSSNISQKYTLGNFENIVRDQGKGPFGSISTIDVYMANGFFSVFFRIFSKIPW
jgi:hypothetical protein